MAKRIKFNYKIRGARKRVRSRKTYSAQSWSTKYTRASYKSDRNWLKALFKNNQSIRVGLEEAGVEVSFRQFEALVQERVSQGKTIEEAVNILGSTHDFTSKEDMGLFNIKNSISKNERNILKKRMGKRINQKIDWDKFKWDEYQQMYLYENDDGTWVGLEFKKGYKKGDSIFRIVANEPIKENINKIERQKMRSKAIAARKDAYSKSKKEKNKPVINTNDIDDDLPF